MCKDFTLKQRILNAADALIANAQDDLSGYIEQAEAFTDQSHRDLRETLDSLHRLVAFRNAFNAGVETGPMAWDPNVLADLARVVMAMEDR
jgi:ABC-type transporter Mla subunit MlaD